MSLSNRSPGRGGGNRLKAVRRPGNPKGPNLSPTRGKGSDEPPRSTRGQRRNLTSRKTFEDLGSSGPGFRPHGSLGQS